MKGTMTIISPNGTQHKTEHTKPVALDVLQQSVGGYIEIVPHFTKYNNKPCVAFCNEEGKLEQLPYNHVATTAWMVAADARGIGGDELVGPVVILQGDDEFMEAL